MRRDAMEKGAGRVNTWIYTPLGYNFFSVAQT